jgi:hypothetical protein
MIGRLAAALAALLSVAVVQVGADVADVHAPTHGGVLFQCRSQQCVQ